MGFYGNLNNSAKTSMKFDIVYPNRAAMEASMLSDGVFVDRYALIEYDDQSFTHKQGWVRDVDYTKIIKYATGASSEVNNIVAYTSKDLSVKFKFSFDTLQEGYGIVVGDIIFIDTTEDIGRYTYLQAEKIGNNLTFKVLRLSDSNEHLSKYLLNYYVDQQWAESHGYPIGKGWDSTVWRKTFDNDTEKYVMQAELNSTAPTFSLKADPPTTIPALPHFDQNSTNTHHTLHWQPQWGFRVKAAEKINMPLLDAEGNELNGGQTTLASSKHYGAFSDVWAIPSDVSTIWTSGFIDKETGKKKGKYFTLDQDNIGHWNVQEDSDELWTVADHFPAAIYFNKAGFNPEFINYSPGFDPLSFNYVKDKNTPGAVDVLTDSINVEPFGRSGIAYLDHNNDVATPAEDTQELSIMLPSLGNAVARIWDIIYGNKELNDNLKQVNEETGEVIYRRNTDIAWENAANPIRRKGLRLFKTDKNKLPILGVFKDGYEDPMSAEINTLAGCINTLHDLIGMIVVQHTEETVPDAELMEDDKIYYVPTKGFFYKDIGYVWDNDTDLNKFKPVEGLEQFNVEDEYYFINYRNYLRVEKPTTIQIVQFKDKENDVKPVTFIDTYEKDTYYYWDNLSGIEYYVLESSPTPRSGITYYTLQQDFYENRFYKPDTYYQLIDGSMDKAKDATMNANDYYELKLVTNPDGGIDYTYTPVKDLIQWDETKIYFRYDPSIGGYTQILEIPDGRTGYYFLEATPIEGTFYQPNTFHYLDDDDYILGIENEPLEDVPYFQIINPPINVDKKFYIPGRYYYEVAPGKFEIDQSITMTEGRDYYLIKEIYVKEDTSGNLASGSIWYGDRDNIPPSVTLGTLKEEPHAIQLEGLGDNINTILGLILRLNRTIGTATDLNRNNTSLTGQINTLKDLTTRFATMKTGTSLVIDKFGRVTGAKICGDDWISLAINDTAVEDEYDFIINHKNSGATAGTYGTNNTTNLSLGSQFIVPNITIDQKGHITQVSDITLTLPSLNNIKMNGYSIAKEKSNLSSADSILEAIAKLEKRIQELENA